MDEPPKFQIGQSVVVYDWTDKRTGVVMEITRIFHRRLEKHTWGYKVKFDNAKTASKAWFPEGYLREKNA